VTASASVNTVASELGYGLSQEHPIKVGSTKLQDGPRNEREYLDRLRTDSGTAITYTRLGSCCAFESESVSEGKLGLLDKYKVVDSESNETTILYFNFYDPGDQNMAPPGFTLIVK
jgi:hypothetical protein